MSCSGHNESSRPGIVHLVRTPVTQEAAVESRRSRHFAQRFWNGWAPSRKLFETLHIRDQRLQIIWPKIDGWHAASVHFRVGMFEKVC